MKFCRKLARKLFFENKKAEKRHIKELKKGSVHNLLTTSLQKILLSVAGITMLASPLFGATQSKITALGDQTKIQYDEAKKLHTITTTKIQGQNAFNAFKEFQLSSNEIANLHLPNNTSNLLNFVYDSKIDIQGTLNAVKDSKIGGNLYFLSNKGLVVGSGGVINAGAFYAMTPTKSFMKKFVKDSGFVSSIKDTDVNLILEKKIGNYNVAKDEGVIIDPKGFIHIYGQINTVNGIGLYAGGTVHKDNDEAFSNPIDIGKNAKLNTFSKDQLNAFSSLVNVEGISIPTASEIVETEGKIELVSVHDNTQNQFSLLKAEFGYSDFVALEAYSKVDVKGKLQSRGDINIQSYALNGTVEKIDKNGVKYFDSTGNNLSKISSEVSFSGKANAEGNITIEAIADNENKPAGFSLKNDLIPSIIGVNINADFVFAKTKAKVDVKKDSLLNAKLALKIDAITSSSQQMGLKVYASMDKNKIDTSKQARMLPATSAVYAQAETESIVNFDGTAISRAESINEDEASISLRSELNSTLDVSSTAEVINNVAPMQAALGIGKSTNNATLTIGENASFETKQDVEIVSETNTESYVEAASKASRNDYFVPAIGISMFNSDSIVNIEKTNINLDNQKDSFTIKANNNVLGDELIADAGITSEYEWERIPRELKENVTALILEKAGLAGVLEVVFGGGDDPILPTKKTLANVTGAVAYGGGSHNSKINIKPGAKIITTGDLVLDSKTYINDTKYDSTSYNYPETEDENDVSAKTGFGLAALISNYDYNSQIIIDDSTTPAKTQIVGNSVTINSSVEQPYNRTKIVVDALKNAALHLKNLFTSEEYKEIGERLANSIDNLENGKGSFSDTLALLGSLKDFAGKITIGDDGLVSRLIAILEHTLAFKDQTNFLNYTVNSYVNSSEGDTLFDFAGSVFVGTNKAKSNLFVGKNTIINSKGDGENRNIALNSKTDITTTAMVGGLPLIGQNIGGEEAVSIGGSVIAHTNDSVSELLIADSAKIGSENTEKLSITSDNKFNPTDLIVGASSASKGFNIMTSVITSDSKANVLIDNSVNLAADTLNLYAYNNTTANNIVGSLMLTDSLGVGIGAAVTSLTKEAQIIYNDNDLYWQKKRKELELRTTDPTQSEISNSVATITADVVEVVAKTSGTVNTIGIAGSVGIDDRSKFNKVANQATMYNDFADTSTINKGMDYLKFKLIGKILSILPFNLSNKSGYSNREDKSTGYINNINQSVPSLQQILDNVQDAREHDAEPRLSLSVNGSVGVNKINNTTKVDLNKANIKFNKKENAKIDVSAINSAHHLSFAGAAGVIVQGRNYGGKTVGVGGSVAVNLINNKTESLVSNSNIIDAKQINSTALNGGETIASALGLSIIGKSQEEDDAGSGAVNTSVNLLDNTVTSKLDNTNAKASTTSNKANMVVTAYERDNQITGGISGAVGKQKGAVGVSVDVSKINNTLTAEISKGKYLNMQNVEVNAFQANTIVNAGVALSVAKAYEEIDTFGGAGAGVYAELTNTTNANINNATINAENLSANARDVRSTDDMVSNYETNLKRDGSDVNFIELDTSSIDREGKPFYTNLDTATGTTDLLESATGRKGSLLVTVAASGVYGDVAVGMGAAINEIRNEFNVNISNSTINTDSFTAKALSYTTSIDVGAGAAIAGADEDDDVKGSGAGSAAWNDIKNKAKVTIEHNNITSKDLEFITLNKSLLVGVAGAVSPSTGGGLAAAGASLSYNSIDNSANTKLADNNIKVKGNNKGDFSVKSENKSNLWGVALEVGANEKVAVGGSISINEIDNSATSSISSSTVGISGTNYKSLNVLATDSADIKSLSGMVSQGSKFAVGGSVAVNKIKGDTSTELDNVRFKSDSTKLESYSDSNILTLALGTSIGGTVAADGTVVVDNNSRNVYSTINKSTTDNATGTVDVATKRFGNTGSMAVVVTGSDSVAAGAGVSVNKMTGTAKTKLSGNNLTVKNLNASTISDQDITNIGVAGSGAGFFGLSGSVSVNTLKNDTITEVSGGGKIISENNIGVIAQSDDSIKNYAGVLAVGIGKVDPDAPNVNLDNNANQNRNKFLKFFDNIGKGLNFLRGKPGGMASKLGGIGVGVSVSVNNINGNTNAFVNGVDLTAKGNDANTKVITKDKIENSAINDAYVDSKTINIKSSLADDRKEQQYSGIVVDSSSTHTVKAFLASVGIGGLVGVNANVNVNTIAGETNAYINNSTINKGLNGKTAGDVNVYAKDYTNTSGFIGNVTLSGTAGVGVSADTNKVTRNTYAKATNIKTGSVAKAFDVKAMSKQGLSSFVVGLAASLKVSVAGNVSVTLLNSITSSLIDNANISVNSMDSGSDHYARSHVMAGSAGIGVATAGVGAAVVVTNDKSQSLAKVNNSKIGINSGYAGDVKINSNNDDKYDITGFSVGAGVYAGVAGTVAVNYMENQIDTTVASSTIGTSASRAKSVEIKSKDVSTINTDCGSGALGAAGVGAAVNVDTFNGQTNTNISKSKVYSTNDVNVGASEERNSKEFALSISGGVGGLSANVLVINSGKKLDFSETNSKDVQGDVDKSLDMANQALNNDYVSKYNQGALSDAEIKQVLAGQPTYSASQDGKAITLTKVDGSTIDSKSGKVSSETKANGTIGISSNGGSAGLVGVMGNFGFIYDNKNVNSQFTNSTINAGKGIDLYSKAGGNTSLAMTQGSVGGFDYSGAFSYVFMNNNTSIGVAGSNLTNKTNDVNIVSTDETSGNTNAKGFQFGGGAVGTIFSKVNNTSNTYTTVGKTKIDNSKSDTASHTINISATKNNKLVAEAYAGTGGALSVSVISPVTKDYGKSAVTLDTGNVFGANELNVNSTNMPTLNSFMKCANVGVVGVGVGDVSAYQFGSSNLTVKDGSKYNVGNVNYVANINSEAVQESKAYTVGIVDIKANRVDSIASQTVNVNVEFSKNNYANNTVLNVCGENIAKSKIDVDGVAVGGLLSVCNNRAEANNDLVTNVNVNGKDNLSSFAQINVVAKSEADNTLYANGDGGGAIAISPYSAQVESNINLKTNTKLSGNLQAEQIKADAVGVADYKGSTSSVQGSIAGGNGAITEANIKMDTNTKVADSAKLTAKEIALKASNDIRTGFERNGLNTKSSMYGGFGGSVARSRQNITATSLVDIGKNASLIADDLVNIDAFTQTNLKNSSKSTGAGIGSHPSNRSDTEITLNDYITTGEGSLIKTTEKYGDINLATSYNFLASYTAYSEVEGSAGGSTSATSKYFVTNNNKIDLKGDIYSKNDINIYTDRNTKGVLSNLKLYGNAEAYTRSVIPWSTDAILECDIKRNNSINVGSNSLVRGIHHITMNAEAGKLNYTPYTKKYTWYSKDKEGNPQKNPVTTVSQGSKGDKLADNNSINVDGKVIAGIENKVNITIDGKVMFDESASGDGIVRTPTITCNSDEYKDQIKYGTMEYANRLFKRYEEIVKLCAENAGTLVGVNYEAEKQRLIAEMEKYGLYDSKTGQLVKSLSIDYVELPDIVSSGGNVYLNIDNGKKVTGNGLIQAKGAPEIKVNNNSNLYMIVNDLSIIEAGGDILLKDLSLGEKAQSTLAVKEAKTDASKNSLIDVRQNWEGAMHLTYTDPSTKKVTDVPSYTPLSNLEINGHIENDYGQVNFFNAYKDIVIQGKSAKDSASIKAATISISAPKGSIAQGYTEGITNIGYTPEIVLKDYAKQRENEISKGVTTDKKDTKGQNLTLEQMTKYEEEYKKSGKNVNDSSSGVWLAGGSVFLNGDDINVNGTIQSGYSKFVATLDDSRINEIKDRYLKKNSPEVTDAYLKEYCKLNQSGMLWDESTGTYQYVVQAYYNPQTDKVILEDINSQGGKIYLTGRISNTSNGKIFAADGASDINIVNNTGKDLVANSLDVGEREGLIRIMDLGKNTDDKGNKILATLTEMTSKDTKVWYVSSQGQSKNPDKVSGVSSEYKPQEGLTYNWSTGYQSINKYTYTTSYDFTIWGLIDYNEQHWNSMKEKMDRGEITPEVLNNKEKQSGTYIGNYTDIGNNTYQLYLENRLGKTDGPYTSKSTSYDNWTHFSGTDYYTSVYKTGNTETFKHSIKADYPIKIGFIHGNGDINVETNSNLTLNGDITSKNNNAKVTLTSSNGYIEQSGGKIYADNIWMKATNGIGIDNAINQQMQSTNGVFSAITTNGDVNLLSVNKAGEKDSKLKLTANTNSGNVNVIADASLLNGAESVNAKGSRIDLTSNYGSIGTGKSLLTIQAGQAIAKPGDTLSASVNATALKDVALEQTSGDMRIGKIVSRTGDVYITSSGNVVDALPPSGIAQNNESANELIEKWKSLGIISEDGKDNSAEKKKERIDGYKTTIKTQFTRYTDLKKYFTSDEHKNETDTDAYKEYQTFVETFGNYDSADKWLEAQNKDKNSEYYRLQNEVTYGWTQDQLLYAIQNSIINKESGSTTSEKSPSDANIKGRNIIINAGGGIGRDEGYSVVDISNLQSAKGIETLKTLAAAEASDVKWGYNGDTIDENKATINRVNGILIDASGDLQAIAKGNIYLEDVNKNAIKIRKVDSGDGNIRIYGKNGIYKAISYSDNTILSGKDLILESGDGPIGSSTAPITTNMSGYVTARSNSGIWLYQNGVNNLVISAMYAGGGINIHAKNSILSVYNGNQADELGYINSNGDLTLLSDEGDIGEANGNGLRVKLAKDKVLNAEANSIYIKGYGDNKINLGRFVARDGNIGLDNSLWDVVLNNVMSAKNIELVVRSLTQLGGTLSVNNLLKVVSVNGISLPVEKNKIPVAYLYNDKTGDVELHTDSALTLQRAENNAEKGYLYIVAQGAVNALQGLLSKSHLLVWSQGDITSSKDIKAGEWLGLCAEKGGIDVKALTANAIDLYADINGITTDAIYSDTYVKANVVEGDITTKDIKAVAGKLELETKNGNITTEKLEASDDISVLAYSTNDSNGELKFKTIQSEKGSVTAGGYNSLTGDYIIAGQEFNVGSYGDVKVNKLVDGLSANGNTSSLYGMNVDIDTLTANNKFEASSGKFTVNHISTSNDASISAYHDVNINDITTNGELSINSTDEETKGDVNIAKITVSNGGLSINNDFGDINVDAVLAEGDVHLNSSKEGNIKIKDNITTKNGGSFYSNINKGELRVTNSDISGKASLYSEAGDMFLTKVKVNDELDARTKDGSIYIYEDINIGKGATVKSDTGYVVLGDSEIGGDLKVSANKGAWIQDATVAGSMLLNGDLEGCVANVLNIGKDLILTTHTGFINVEDATVGEDTYITIDDEAGGNIDIKNIKTGTDSVGDLVVESYSYRANGDDKPYINIKDAVAANKMIINGSSNINMNSAYALNGKLEVKNVGDVVAQVLKAAKETYILSLTGLIDISKVISGDSIYIGSLFGGIEVDDIITLNPDANIELYQLYGDMSISNASTTKDLEIIHYEGNVTIDNVSSGGDITLVGSDINNSIEGLEDSKGTTFNLGNSYAGNDINIYNKLGDVTLTNNNIGNNLNVEVNGKMDISDVNVGNITKITTYGNSVTNINRFKSDSLEIKDNGSRDLNIADSTINSIDSTIGGNLTVNNLVNSNSKLDVKGNATITNLTSTDVTATIGGDTQITDSTMSKLDAEVKGDATINKLTSDDMKAVLNGKSSVADSKLGNVDLTNKGEALIKDSTVNTMVASNDGSLELTTTLVEKLDLANKGNANIHNTNVNSFIADNQKELTINSITGDKLELANKGEALIKDSTVNTMVASNEGSLELTTTPVEKLDLANKGNANIHNTNVNSFIADNQKELTINSITGNKLELASKGNTNINDSKISNVNANISGNATINKLESGNMSSTVSGKSNISDSSITKFDLTNTGESTIANSKIKTFAASNDGELNANKITGDKLELTSAGNTNIDDSNIANINANISGNATINKLVNKQMSSIVSGKADINDSEITSLELANKGTTNIMNSNVTGFKANNDKELNINSLTGDKLELTSAGNTNIDDSNIANINANISGNATINKLESANMTSVVSGKSNISDSSITKFDMINTGESIIANSDFKNITASNDGELNVNKITGDKLQLTSAGNTNIYDSNITNINADISGNATINKLVNSQMTSVVSGKNSIDNSTVAKLDLTNSGDTSVTNSSLATITAKNSGNLNVSDTTTPATSIDVTNSGKSTLKNIETSKIKLVNTGNSSLTKLDVTGSGYFVNRNGNMDIAQLDVTNNFDVDTNAGSISLKEIDIKNDFNFALTGNSGVKFTDIIIGNDFNVYAGKAVLSGETLNVGNNLNTLTYSKYSAPKASMRAAIVPNSGTGRASESEEGFSLIIDKLDIGGGMYVDNPDVTIEVKESTVGNDVKIDAGKEKIQIDKLDVDGGNLDIKGTTGSIKLGDINVDNDTKINLGSGDLTASSLDSKGKVDFKVGGNITSDQMILSENSSVNATAGGNLTASNVEAKSNIDFNVGGNISSDSNIETQTGSVNMIAGGRVDAYKVLAKEQGNIEAVNGDIIIGQIDGKTLVFKQDSNDRTLRIREANVETSVTAGADYIDIDMINHSPSDKELGIDFTLVNGRAMDNVIIRDVNTDNGVNMSNLVSTYGNIHVSNEIFNLAKTYLLKKGDLSNSKLKFRLYGYNPVYSKDPDIIAFFDPSLNHKNYTDISFTNVWHPEKQDYYPLISREDYKLMFDQYTVVQDFETLRLSYRDKIVDVNDDFYSRFELRKLDKSKSFYVEPSIINENGENINLDDIDIPVGVEFDSVSGELKSVGSIIKPQKAMD